MSLLKRIKNVLIPETDEKIHELFDMSNMSALKTMGIITAIIEGVSLIITFIIHIENIHYDQTTIVMTSVVFGCLLTAFFADLFVKKKIHGHYTAVLISGVSIIVMAIFGMYVSYMNFINNRQVIIFYGVNICFVSFFHIAPLFQILFLLTEHLIFYMLLYNYNGAEGVIAINGVIYLLILLSASIISYYREKEFIISTYKAQTMAQDILLRSYQDQLTGLLNRYALDAIPNIQKGAICQIAMADIDHFKNFNDKYGHRIGDEVLKATASSLLDVFRKKDSYRYGGDEFLVMTTIHTEDAFRDRLATWENKLSEVRIEGVDDPIKVSYGVASGRINSQEDVFALIKDADNKLNNIKSIRHRK